MFSFAICRKGSEQQFAWLPSCTKTCGRRTHVGRGAELREASCIIAQIYHACPHRPTCFNSEALEQSLSWRITIDRCISRHTPVKSRRCSSRNYRQYSQSSRSAPNPNPNLTPDSNPNPKRKTCNPGMAHKNPRSCDLRLAHIVVTINFHYTTSGLTVDSLCVLCAVCDLSSYRSSSCCAHQTLRHI